MSDCIDRDSAFAAVRAVASEAGDASGNADRASYMFEHGGNIEQALEALQWAQEQAQTASRKAAFAIRQIKNWAPVGQGRFDQDHRGASI